MAITLAISNGIEAPFFAVMMPVFAKQEYGSATILGLMASAFALGALVGALVYGAVGHRISRRAIWFL